MTGSRQFRLGGAVSIFARAAPEPSGKSPLRVRSKGWRVSRAVWLRSGGGVPGWWRMMLRVRLPCSRIWWVKLEGADGASLLVGRGFLGRLGVPGGRRVEGLL